MMWLGGLCVDQRSDAEILDRMVAVLQRQFSGLFKANPKLIRLPECVKAQAPN
jgi:hypothetical protein